MRFSWILLAMTILLGSCAGPTPEQPLVNQAKKDLHLLFEEHAVRMKRQGEALFPKVSVSYLSLQNDTILDLLQRLEGIPIDQLTAEDQINFELFQFLLQDQADRFVYADYLVPFNAEGGFYTAPGFFAGAIVATDPATKENYLQKLLAYPQYMRANIKLMQAGIEKGLVAPRIIIANYRDKIAPYLEEEVEAHILYRSASAHFESGSEEELLLRSAISDSILPAYQAFDQFMQSAYLPACRAEIGISTVPNGKDYYAKRIRYYTTLDVTPEEVYQQGMSEVARIRAEMEEIIQEVGHEGSFADFLQFLRTDPGFYARSPRELLAEASYLAKKIDGQLPAYFNHLPRLPYGVSPVPEAIAPNYTAGRYSGGSAEDHRAGFYWVNTHALESRPLYALTALTLHEAVPGHHLQISLAQEMEEQPYFRTKMYLSAFGEGWALYGEWLGKEMGIYETPYDHFGRLTYEMWRACRLVVDVGIHEKGWSRQEAIDYLSGNTALSIHECTTEIDRYIGWPGQAVSYKWGELKIKALRKRAEQELGEAFDIRKFHDAVLANGSVLLSILEQEVEAFIAAEKAIAQEEA